MLNVTRQQSDRRTWDRTPCALKADLDDAGHGFIRNLSLGGAYIEAEMEHVPCVGQVIFMTIPYRKGTRVLMIKATVAWTGPDGMGVTFLKPQRKMPQS